MVLIFALRGAKKMVMLEKGKSACDKTKRIEWRSGEVRIGTVLNGKSYNLGKGNRKWKNENLYM